VAKAQTTLEKIGLTSGKAVLIGVLALALVVVIYMQYGGEPEDSARGSAPRVSAPRPVAQAANPTNTEPLQEADFQVALAEFDDARWQAPQLASVIAYDPFAVPAAFPQPARLTGEQIAGEESGDDVAARNAQLLAEAVERYQAELTELQQRGVHVILGERNEFVAMVGDRTLHVGDEINGFTVTAIEVDGVRVERIGIE
jgi:hypothetical protein